jgi:hypothetical protein
MDRKEEEEQPEQTLADLAKMAAVEAAQKRIVPPCEQNASRTGRKDPHTDPNCPYAIFHSDPSLAQKQ